MLKTFDNIVTIGRGGAIIGAYLAQKLGLPSFCTVFVRHIGEGGDVIDLYGEMRGMVRPGDDWLITLTIKSIDHETGKVELDYVEESKTLIKIEKDGETIKSFEADQRGWVNEKDIAQNLIKTEEVEEGILHYRLRKAIPGYAVVKLEK